MKKTISITAIVVLCLVVFFTQALAFNTTVSAKPTHTPKPDETETSVAPGDKQNQPEKKGAKPDKPGKGKQHAGKKFNFKGEVVSYTGGVIVLSLKDGSTVSIAVDADSDIRVAGPKGGVIDIQPNTQAMVQAVMTDQQTYLAVRVKVFPSKPQHVHRVGEVTAYEVGSSITVKDNNGSTTFQIAPDVKILPAERVEGLKVGARVTIISPRDPSGATSVAQGIVVHPEK
jgi:hypothetical protein